MPPYNFGEANYPPSQPLDGDDGVEDTTSILEQFDVESAIRESDDDDTSLKAKRSQMDAFVAPSPLELSHQLKANGET
jgi:hypothetical protein